MKTKQKKVSSAKARLNSAASAEIQPNPHFIGTTIRDLRRRAHLSQGELAKRLGMRQGPLCNIEKGRNLPSAPVLFKLAEILGVTTDDLLGRQRYTIAPPGETFSVCESPSVHSEEPARYGITPDYTFYDFPGYHHWHGTSRLATVPGEPLARKIEALVKCYLALEDICGVPRHAHVPLRIPHTTTPEGVTHLSGQMRGLFGISHAVVFDYLELFENHGLRVIFTPLMGVAESLSFLDTLHQNCFILIETNLTSERQIFRLAGELGLLLMLPPGEHTFGQTDFDKPARLFAANFLMPAEVVRNCVSQIGVRPDEWDMPFLLRLKHRFGVSAEAFNYRLLELGLITEGLQQKLRTQIKDHYAAHNYAEPGHSRRLLSPNGRLGDLLHVALKKHNPEAAAIASHFKTLDVETA